MNLNVFEMLLLFALQKGISDDPLKLPRNGRVSQIVKYPAADRGKIFRPVTCARNDDYWNFRVSILYDFDYLPIIAIGYEFIAENHADLVPVQGRPTLGHCSSKNGC
jgi:hypothetical protein